MTDQEIKELAYEPIAEAWKIIRMTQNLTQDDEEGWAAYVEAHDVFCKKRDSLYNHYLGMAIMEAVEEIKNRNMEDKSG